MEDFKYLFNEINIQHKTFILITLKGKSILNNQISTYIKNQKIFYIN